MTVAIFIHIGYLVGVPLGIGNAATDAVIAHSGKPVPCHTAQPTDILTVYRTIVRHIMHSLAPYSIITLHTM
jgi:hypothetical protein